MWHVASTVAPGWGCGEAAAVIVERRTPPPPGDTIDRQWFPDQHPSLPSAAESLFA